MISVTDCLNHLQTSLASIFVSLCDYYFCNCLFIFLGTLLTQLFRIRIGNAPEEREMNPNRKTSLQLSVRAYGEKGVSTVVLLDTRTVFYALP
uniref:Uncharacterized protein n=1 Tax=Aegilops tauschii subsp. strangulata TaxID=200361 RepID=A0A453NGZ7_AEGTS